MFAPYVLGAHYSTLALQAGARMLDDAVRQTEDLCALCYRTNIRLLTQTIGDSAHAAHARFYHPRSPSCMFEDIKRGDCASLTMHVSKLGSLYYARLSSGYNDDGSYGGDDNPIHFSDEEALNSFFEDLIAHGGYIGSSASTIFGTKLPGPGAVYRHQEFDFLEPVRFGDTIKTTVVVTHKNRKRRLVYFKCTWVNQHGTPVMGGKATLWIAPPGLTMSDVKKKREEKALH